MSDAFDWKSLCWLLAICSEKLIVYDCGKACGKQGNNDGIHSTYFASR